MITWSVITDQTNGITNEKYLFLKTVHGSSILCIISCKEIQKDEYKNQIHGFNQTKPVNQVQQNQAKRMKASAK